MNSFRKLRLLYKEIGPRELFAYAKYRGQLSTGSIKKATPSSGWPELKIPGPSILINQISVPNWALIQSENITGMGNPSEMAQMYRNGEFLAFWGEPCLINLRPPFTQLEHWTFYQNDLNGQDIKLVWEPARFSWSLDLANRYAATRDESLAEMFWKKVEEFIKYNPPNLGPNWSSAQEVALRTISWLFALSVFQESKISTPNRINLILQSNWQHFKRIPPTLDYARSQKNNHILSESLGLILAGDVFSPISEVAARWQETGVREFENALIEQIDAEGNYSQHSSIYHRMMLQLALVYHAWSINKGRSLTDPALEKLKLATRWAIALMDPISGKLPNLGHNDGTLLLPFGCENFNDFRPTAQAAALAFLGAPCLPPGNWDELALWLGLPTHDFKAAAINLESIAVHKVGSPSAWGTMRAVQFNGRPAHADQLHVDLWWHGENIGMDAGTFSYNAPPPWQNALDSTRIHNTITVDGLDQMQRISRFLWLDQAKAEWLETTEGNSVRASHDGYRRLGIIHQRSLTYLPENRFRVMDELLSGKQTRNFHEVTIHWLLPDWEFHFDKEKLVLIKGNRQFSIEIIVTEDLTDIDQKPFDISIIRAGKTLLGNRQDPNLGWISHTYLNKVPAVSFSYTFRSRLPLKFLTDWTLMNEPSS